MANLSEPSLGFATLTYRHSDDPTGEPDCEDTGAQADDVFDDEAAEKDGFRLRADLEVSRIFQQTREEDLWELLVNQVTRDLPFWRQYDQAGGVVDLILFGVVGPSETQGVSDSTDVWIGAGK